jgi:hypothetical protein
MPWLIGLLLCDQRQKGEKTAWFNRNGKKVNLRLSKMRERVGQRKRHREREGVGRGERMNGSFSNHQLTGQHLSWLHQ